MSRRSALALLLALVVAMGVLSERVEAARSFSTASSQYLQVDSAPDMTLPFTMTAWVYWLGDSGDAVNDVVMWVGDKDSQNYYQMTWGQSTSQFRCAVVNPSGSSAANTTLDLPANEWIFVSAVFGSATSRTVHWYRPSDGADDSGSNTDNRSLTNTPDRVGIGKNAAATNSYFNGRIAHACIWSGVALGSRERLGLGKGQHPLAGRRAFLGAYWPLNGDASPEPDLIGGRSLALFNAPTKADAYPLRGGFGR